MECRSNGCGYYCSSSKDRTLRNSSYGTARAYALQLKLNDVAKLLEETLNEENTLADDLLSKLALVK